MNDRVARFEAACDQLAKLAERIKVHAFDDHCGVSPAEASDPNAERAVRHAIRVISAALPLIGLSAE